MKQSLFVFISFFLGSMVSVPLWAQSGSASILGASSASGQQFSHIQSGGALLHPAQSQASPVGPSTMLRKNRGASFLKISGNISLPSRQLLSGTLTTMEKENMFPNRRLKYSALWAFTALNYLYADLVGMMDANLLSQYQTGTVNGIDITPGFLTGAAAYMQIPLANVFLPMVIKDDNTLRWVQIASGTIATLAQAATLFVGEKPEPYYVLFSAIEIGTTAYITIDAIKWKPARKRRARQVGN